MLALALSVLLAQVPGPQDDPAVHQAALAAVRGDAAGARRALGPLLAATPRSAAALFVLTCVELDAGDFSRAAVLLRQLEVASPGVADARLLRALMEQRRSHPDGRWTDAFRDAWVSAGRPDLSRGHLLEDPVDELPVDDAEAWKRHRGTPAATTLIASGMNASEDAVEEVLASLKAGGSPAMQLAELEFLSSAREGRAGWERLGPVVLAHVQQLARAHPDQMDLALWVQLEPGGLHAPLTDSDLTALEGAVKLPRLGSEGFADLLREARRQLEGAGVKNASGRAMALAVNSVANRGEYLLNSRVKATVPVATADQRRRLGNILLTAGGRKGTGHTLLELSLGTAMQLRGAELLGDAAAVARAKELGQGVRSLNSLPRQVAWSRWPLCRWRAEHLELVLPDEVRYYRAFGG